MLMSSPDICDLTLSERSALEASILERGLDPDDFLAESVLYAPPDHGPTIHHVVLEVGNVRSTLWSEARLSWIDQFRMHLHAGLYDHGGAARSSSAWDLGLRLPFDVRLEQLDSATDG